MSVTATTSTQSSSSFGDLTLKIPQNASELVAAIEKAQSPIEVVSAFQLAVTGPLKDAFAEVRAALAPSLSVAPEQQLKLAKQGLELIAKVRAELKSGKDFKLACLVVFTSSGQIGGNLGSAAKDLDSLNLAWATLKTIEAVAQQTEDGPITSK